MSSLPAVGNWYSGNVAGAKMVAWLCPALYEYFQDAPWRIYVKAEKLPSEIDPIWHVSSDAPQAYFHYAVGSPSICLGACRGDFDGGMVLSSQRRSLA